MPAFTVEKAAAADWPVLREICCETAGSGPVEAARRPFFGDYWVGPYESGAPEWAYVARAEGRVIGYLTGCADTAAFARRAKPRYFLPLALKTALGAYGYTVDARRFLRRFIGLEQDPNALFAVSSDDYPAHLHVNVLEGHRGGVGRTLVERYCADLRAAGVKGAHLFCGAKPVGFYVKLGFTQLATRRHGEVPLFAMGMNLG